MKSNRNSIYLHLSSDAITMLLNSFSRTGIGFDGQSLQLLGIQFRRLALDNASFYQNRYSVREIIFWAFRKSMA